MRTRQEIKALAKEAMGEQRGTAILLGLVFLGVSLASVALDWIVERATGSQGLLYWIVFYAGMFVIYVTMVNMIGEYIKVFKREPASPGAVVTGIAERFWRKLGGLLYMYLWIVIWTVLPIIIGVATGVVFIATLAAIPGIYKTMQYFFTYNVLADCPEVGATQALKVSSKITDGHKLDVFIFCLSYIGWFILSILTLGILYIVYVGPYFYTADAGLYLEMREKALSEGRLTHEELGMTAPMIAPHDPMVFR